MKCPSCERAIEPGQRFCTGCGRSLAGITDVPAAPEAPPAAPPAQVPAPIPEPDPDVEAGEATMWAEPDWAPTGSLPTQPMILTSELQATEAVDASPQVGGLASVPDDVDPLWQTPYDNTVDDTDDSTATSVVPGAYEPAAVGYTTEMPVGYVDPQPDPYAPAVPPAHGFRLTAVTLIAIAAGILTLISMFSTVLTISSSGDLTIGENAPAGFRTGTWIVDDLADNLSIAGLIAAVMMVVGGVASAFGWRWGGGLAGGAGLGFGGIAALAVGLAQFPIDAAHDFARIPSADPFTLSITRDLGYWLLVGTAALGVVLFFASLNDAFADRRPGLNPWIAALGALAVVIAAAGPLIPENDAIFSDNWYLIEAPGEPGAMLLVGRLVQIGLLLLAGVIGFLSVRRWGLSVAIGGSLPLLWLGVSTLFDLTDNPVGPAFRNVGATGMSVHGVTIIGLSALASMLVLSGIAAYEQGVRERR
ncbi:MAG TPA: zinc ribbon domain-containing protein [Ilumatobacter sp.]|nr:zinc ribbon domain-containing protein [Ilumatobacter sp.]